MAVAFPNPLYDVHQQAEAEFQNWAEIEIVQTFGEPQAEYSAIHKAVGLMDLPQRGILELTGRDRLSFLNNLLTNQTWDKSRKAGLPAGQGVYAFLLNLRGRVVADVNVLELGERTLLEMDVRFVEAMRLVLDKYLFGEQVKLVSRVGELHEIALHGPGARELLNEFLNLVSLSPVLRGEGPGEGLKSGDSAGHQAGTSEGPSPQPSPPGTGERREWPAPLNCMMAKVNDIDVVIWRDDPAGVEGHHVIVPTNSVRSVWMNLIAQYGAAELNKRRLRPVGWAAFNATRIEAGRPILGIDFDSAPIPSALPGKKDPAVEDAGAGVLPAETGLFDRAVSVTKGCYLGQEIVARMHARAQVARQIVGIRMDDPALPLAGAQVFDGQSNVIGVITSSTVSPMLSNAPICLGMIKRPFFALETKLQIPAEGTMHSGTVVKLPFVGGST